MNILKQATCIEVGRYKIGSKLKNTPKKTTKKVKP